MTVKLLGSQGAHAPICAILTCCRMLGVRLRFHSNRGVSAAWQSYRSFGSSIGHASFHSTRPVRQHAAEVLEEAHQAFVKTWTQYSFQHAQPCLIRKGLFGSLGHSHTPLCQFLEKRFSLLGSLHCAVFSFTARYPVRCSPTESGRLFVRSQILCTGNGGNSG